MKYMYVTSVITMLWLPPIAGDCTNSVAGRPRYWHFKKMFMVQYDSSKFLNNTMS